MDAKGRPERSSYGLVLTARRPSFCVTPIRLRHYITFDFSLGDCLTPASVYRGKFLHFGPLIHNALNEKRLDSTRIIGRWIRVGYLYS